MDRQCSWCSPHRVRPCTHMAPGFAEATQRSVEKATLRAVRLTREQRSEMKSLIEDSGYSPTEARGLVLAGGL